jgi:uncharacterized protein YwgA
MGSIENGLTPQEAVLLALAAAGGTVEGRTSMQKITYFVAVALEQDLGHRAHYYGPYSRPVESALADAALGDEITETMERFPNYYSGPDIRKYTYELTPDGEELVRELEADHPEEATTIDDTVGAIKEAVPDLDQNTLSMAAKNHFIVDTEGGTAKLSDIPDLARELGWRISDGQVQKSVELLKGLDLLTVN